MSGEARVQWQDKNWRLLVKRFTLPNGASFERGIVDHPGSVVIVPLLGESVLMLWQHRSTLGHEILEVPAGTREWDEAWLDCAQRELQEETGYRAADFIPLGEVWPAPGLTNELMALYLATGLEPDPLPGDPDEQIQVRPMALQDLVVMALDGRLKDAKSVVSILRAAKYLSLAANGANDGE